ncbi:MAG TPA: 4-alpha-glucanotransferase [Kofleriaceae bacterium]|nr:4-alpha-glucanotransferase [Kofleriaceae bacterium]
MTTSARAIDPVHRRAAGILLHVTSLPGPHGTGDLGEGARAFVDFLAAAGQQVWQMLPIHPTGAGHSPYSGASAFAGDPSLISLHDLVDEGWLEPSELPPPLADDRTDHDAAWAVREPALRRAFSRFRPGRDYERFERDAASWLADYTLFAVLARVHGGPRWTAWPAALRDREPAALAEARREHRDELAYLGFVQYVFAQQWARLRRHARARGVRLIGDIPIYVAHESADVWTHRAQFHVDATGEPSFVAGVPPDYFSKTGQRWGNPLYRWKRMRRDGYRWWRARFETLLERFDQIRLDHFIGFSRFWKIPASEPTAEHGRWTRGPGADFFARMRAALGELPFIAEDLGEVTPAVRALRDRFALPGMRVFQFAFGTDVQAAAFQPHRYPANCVAYTGTHDNDTLIGWLDDPGGDGAPRSPAQAALERQRALEYVVGPGATLDQPAHLAILRALYASAADTVVVPWQDVLGLGSATRMNNPSHADGNWTWRMDRGALTPALAHRLHELARVYERLPAPASA